MDMRPHRKLDVWKKSMMFTSEIYKATAIFPKAEQYGLVAQMRRAAVSIPSNLAEGAGRKGAKEFSQFLNIAQGSISELDTQIELAHMLGYIEAYRHTELNAELTDISKMFYGLSRSICKT